MRVELISDSAIKRAIRLFLYPSSPAAIYKNPFPFVSAVAARSLNTMLRIRNKVWTSRAVVCEFGGWSGSRFGYSSGASVNRFHTNDICLRCGANHRGRQIMRVLVQSVDLTQNLKIVDVGAASATRGFFRDMEHVQYCTVDPYKDSDIKSSITDIDLPDDVADVVLCCHVLEHIDDDCKGMAELHRVLKPHGRAILMVPQRPGLAVTVRIAETTFDGYGHICDYGDDFPNRVQEVGFELISSYPSEGRGPIHVFGK